MTLSAGLAHTCCSGTVSRPPPSAHGDMDPASLSLSWSPSSRVEPPVGSRFGLRTSPQTDSDSRQLDDLDSGQDRLLHWDHVDPWSHPPELANMVGIAQVPHHACPCAAMMRPLHRGKRIAACTEPREFALCLNSEAWRQPSWIIAVDLLDVVVRRTAAISVCLAAHVANLNLWLSPENPHPNILHLPGLERIQRSTCHACRT